MEHPLPNTIIVDQLPIAELVILFMAPTTATMQRRIANQIHKLFIDDLWRFCKKSAGQQFGHTTDWEEVAQEICYKTFQLLFAKLPTMKLKEACSDKEAGKIIGSWLRRTANNLILKHIDTQVKQKEQFNLYKEYVALDLEDSETLFRTTEKSYDSQKFLSVWGKMSAMAKEILMLSYEYDCFPTSKTKNKKHLPAEIIEALCDKYNTHKDAIRQAKSRAFRDLLACEVT
jgi:DNA-directed RNA polymerase specialized sigma24 family protein